MKSNQFVKLFQYTRDEHDIDSQINRYIRNNPDIKISQITLTAGDSLYNAKALVLFERIDSDQETESTALLINEAKEQLFESVIAYLERPENWTKLKDCWLCGGRSDDLRKLLTEALCNS